MEIGQQEKITAKPFEDKHNPMNQFTDKFFN